MQKALLRLNQNVEITPAAADYLEAAIIKAAASQQGSNVQPPACYQ